MSGIRWTDEEYELYVRANGLARFNRPAVQTADPKPVIKNASEGEDSDHEVYSRVRIHYHSKRRRLIDPDRLYSHPATDGLRKGGLLIDDSLKYVESVTNSQEQSKDEETLIEVWELNE